MVNVPSRRVFFSRSARASVSVRFRFFRVWSGGARTLIPEQMEKCLV